MSRPSEDDRPIFSNPRGPSPVDRKLQDTTTEDLDAWKTLEIPRTAEESARIEKVVESAIEDARKTSQRLLAQPDEPVPSVEDLARLGEVNQGSPSGRLPRQQWGSGMGLKKD